MLKGEKYKDDYLVVTHVPYRGFILLELNFDLFSNTQKDLLSLTKRNNIKYHQTQVACDYHKV